MMITVIAMMALTNQAQLHAERALSIVQTEDFEAYCFPLLV